jgi:predicted AAA+ superfamily ATPase
MVRQLRPWYENLGKRLVKAPKVYIRDSGIFHSLMSLETWGNLQSHPKFGASWEGFALEQIIRRVPDRSAYFWGTHAGAELDLLIIWGGKRWGFEFKTSEAPSATKSMHSALKDLKLQRLWVVYPGVHQFQISERMEAVPLAEALKLDILKK